MSNQITIIGAKTSVTGLVSNTDVFTFSQTMLLNLWGAAATDSVEILQVRVKDGSPPSTSNGQCWITPATEAQIVGLKPLKRCSATSQVDAVMSATVSQLAIPAGSYVFRFTGTGFAARATLLDGVPTEQKPCNFDCALLDATNPAAALLAAVQAMTPAQLAAMAAALGSDVSTEDVTDALQALSGANVAGNVLTATASGLVFAPSTVAATNVTSGIPIYGNDGTTVLFRALPA
jgi:hypothetical protein